MSIGEWLEGDDPFETKKDAVVAKKRLLTQHSYLRRSTRFLSPGLLRNYLIIGRAPCATRK